MTAETAAANPTRYTIEARSRSVETSGLRLHPGERLKALLSGIAIAATGAVAATVIGPAFVACFTGHGNSSCGRREGFRGHKRKNKRYSGIS